MKALFTASAASGNAETLVNKEPIVTTLYVEVIDAGSWSGSIKFGARLYGSNATFTRLLAITNLSTNATIAGSSGITAAGLYAVDVSGMEVQAQHTRSAGAVTVNAVLVRG